MKTIIGQIDDLQKGIKGTILMTPELELICTSIINGHVPESLKSISYPSNKQLGRWINDLLERLSFFRVSP